MTYLVRFKSPDNGRILESYVYDRDVTTKERAVEVARKRLEVSHHSVEGYEAQVMERLID